MAALTVGKDHRWAASLLASLDHLVSAQQERFRALNPSVFADLRLITNSNFAGCSTVFLRVFRPSRSFSLAAHQCAPAAALGADYQRRQAGTSVSAGLN
jgi:hypothetical protein